MAAEVETMISYKETPWHSLGKILEVPPESVEDAIVQAGLDWEVELCPNQTVWRGKVLPIRRNSVIRVSDGRVLGENVGLVYRPIQNREAFSFLNEAVSQKILRIETAGSLRHGARVWMLVRVIGTEMDVVRGDSVIGYFLVSNSHDGTLTLRMGFTGVRVVCMNTLTLAMSGDLIRLRHTESAVEALTELKDIIDWKKREFSATVESMRSLARKGVVESTIRDYVRRVFEPEIRKETVVDEDMNAKVEKMTAKIIPLFEAGRGNDLPNVRGTAWAMYNSVTEFMTWHRGRSVDTRLDSLWFGDNGRINARALTEALKIAA